MAAVNLNVPSSVSPTIILSAEGPPPPPPSLYGHLCSLHTHDCQILPCTFSACLSPPLGCEPHEHQNLLAPSCVSSWDSRSSEHGRCAIALYRARASSYSHLLGTYDMPDTMPRHFPCAMSLEVSGERGITVPLFYRWGNGGLEGFSHPRVSKVNHDAVWI